jgi:hypothetical protein
MGRTFEMRKIAKFFMATSCILSLLIQKAQAGGNELFYNKVANESADCAVWTDARRRGAAATYETFVAGFLNGAEVWATEKFYSSNGNIFFGVSTTTVFSSIDDYCKQYPAAQIVNAASDLLLSHKRR